MKSLSLTNVALMEQPSGDVLVMFRGRSYSSLDEDGKPCRVKYHPSESDPFLITKAEMQQIVKAFSDEQRNH